MSKFSIENLLEDRKRIFLNASVEALPIYIGKLAERGPCIIVVPNERRGRELKEALPLFCDKKIYMLSEGASLLLHYGASNRSAHYETIAALSALAKGENCIVIGTARSAFKEYPDKNRFKDTSINVKVGQRISQSNLKTRLFDMGYELVSMVEAAGECCQRGGIIDVYSPRSNKPVRLEFFGDEVDSIRSFDPVSQRSDAQLSECEIALASMPSAYTDEKEAVARLDAEFQKYLEEAGDTLSAKAKETIEERRSFLEHHLESMLLAEVLEGFRHFFSPKGNCLWEYSDRINIAIWDIVAVKEALDSHIKHQVEEFKQLLSEGKLMPYDERLLAHQDFFSSLLECFTACFLPFNDIPSMLIKKGESPLAVNTEEQIDANNKNGCCNVQNTSESLIYELADRSVPSFNGKIEELIKFSAGFDTDWRIYFVLSNENVEQNIKESLLNQGIKADVRYVVGKGRLKSGFIHEENLQVYITEKDIFGKTFGDGHRSRLKRRGDISSFSQLKEGDYLVHELHGVGKYQGLVQLEALGSIKDYLHIAYRGKDKLYVPVEQLDMVQKYVSAEGITPHINRLSGSEWKNTRASAAAAIDDMAEELIKLYAERSSVKGFAFSPDGPWQRDFEGRFEYEETSDQLRAIEEIKADMEKPVPMDRLLCGDVGFGKTEVAARAIFKALCDGKQVVLLAPTTILADQHYHTFMERMDGFPFKIAMMSRFVSKSLQQQTIEEIKEGRVDLVIGTHRLLTDDVEFRDMGLIVIDEEQRFGVKAKEKLQTYKSNTDVLVMSATPIPRTLNMSLSAIKDMSLIENPPEERYPVQTFVIEEDDEIIKEAITREINRNGQVFVLHNRVGSIYRVAKRVNKIMGEDVNIAVAHGQMSEKELSQIMDLFSKGEIQVLVSTTIIETGINIQRANTIIILDADRFGLAQLYQLRGRVGRSNRLAYAYLMYKKGRVLSEVAEKRLKAIKDFTEFGSGYKIAMRDLEIRGAGNLLGREQSGHMYNVGYELYTKMVSQAIERKKGQIVREDEREIIINTGGEAYIPGWYMEDEHLKLDFYKRFSHIENISEENLMWQELLDRFGEPPNEVENLLRLNLIKKWSLALGVSSIEKSGADTIVQFEINAKLAPERLILVIEHIRGTGFVHAGKMPYIKINKRGNEALRLVYEVLSMLACEVQ